MAQGGRVARKAGDRWEAKFPEFAFDDGRQVGEMVSNKSINSPQRGKLMNWQYVTAFQESHLHSFAYDDARLQQNARLDDEVVRGEDGKVRIYEGKRIYPTVDSLPASRIFVQFKATKRNPIVGYVYWSKNHAFMKHVYQAMCIANNAGVKGRGPGVALHAYLEQNPEVEYQQSNAPLE